MKLSDWFLMGACIFAGMVIGAAIMQEATIEGFTCTQQRAVKDTMPQEFECTQWTKGSKDGE